MKNKRGIAMQTLTYYLIGIAVLALAFGVYSILFGKGVGAIAFIKNLFGYGVS